MKKTIALYKSQYNNCSPVESSMFEYYDKDDEYLRISEPIEVEFIEVDKATQVKNEVAIIDNLKEVLKTEMLKKLDELDTRKKELLAISVD